MEQNEVPWGFSAHSSGDTNTCISCTFLMKVLSMSSCQRKLWNWSITLSPCISLFLKEIWDNCSAVCLGSVLLWNFFVLSEIGAAHVQIRLNKSFQLPLSQFVFVYGENDETSIKVLTTYGKKEWFRQIIPDTSQCRLYGFFLCVHVHLKRYRTITTHKLASYFAGQNLRLVLASIALSM